MKKTIFISGIVALIITASGLGVFYYLNKENNKTIKIEHIDGSPTSNVLYTLNNEGELTPLDFTRIADKVMSTVVHITSTQTVQSGYNNQNPWEEFFRQDPFRDFFNPRNSNPQEPQIRIGKGSGVIISPDGYIVTNNHVIADAEDIEVSLSDNRIYKATVIGTDPTTDLALLQIKEKNLNSVSFANSDEVRVGEWVMAVGNPFNLTSTVTAGIVSAKGRNINILREQFAVESFIQTDAAINPGNSGGALVNLDGALIGINTAIASNTGTYNGYGFAIPSNMVSKVVEDLMKYGAVQRGVLGIMIRSVDGNLQKEKGLEVTSGAYVDSLLENSAAAKAGIQIGDVIVAINGQVVKGSPELQEQIARHRPGDRVEVTINRQGKEKTIPVNLLNRAGQKESGRKAGGDVLNQLGIELETLDLKKAKQLNLVGGVVVKQIYAGKIKRSTNMRAGFIITKIDGQPVSTLEEFTKILQNKSGGVLLEGVYPDIPGTHYFAFGM